MSLSEFTVWMDVLFFMAHLLVPFDVH